MTLTNGQLYKSLFENMLNGFAHCKGIFDDDGQLVDWIYLEVNRAFETQTGLKGVRGRQVSELIPNIREMDKELFSTYQRVANKQSLYENFEYFLSSLGIWFQISVYSVEAGTFTAVFENINDHKKKLSDLENANHDILLAFVRTLKFRDQETDQHSERVTDMALGFSRHLGMEEAELNCIYKGALLHDIGKMFVPDAILHKPAKLMPGEWVIMKLHPQHAYDLLSPIDSLNKCIDIPYCHHEKWDGSGYPRGLKDHQIPLAARIFSIVDSFDAITSKRAYHEAMSHKMAFNIIESESGKSFDPYLVGEFIKWKGE